MTASFIFGCPDTLVLKLLLLGTSLKRMPWNYEKSVLFLCLWRKHLRPVGHTLVHVLGPLPSTPTDEAIRTLISSILYLLTSVNPFLHLGATVITSLAIMICFSCTPFDPVLFYLGKRQPLLNKDHLMLLLLNFVPWFLREKWGRSSLLILWRRLALILEVSCSL